MMPAEIVGFFDGLYIESGEYNYQMKILGIVACLCRFLFKINIYKKKKRKRNETFFQSENR